MHDRFNHIYHFIQIVDNLHVSHDVGSAGI